MSSTAVPAVKAKVVLRPWHFLILGLCLGSLVSGSALYFTAIKSGDRQVKAGLETIAGLKTANAKLSNDLASADSSLATVTADRDARQRVLNSVNQSVEQLGSGLAGGIDSLDQVIQSIQDIIAILQHG